MGQDTGQAAGSGRVARYSVQIAGGVRTVEIAEADGGRVVVVVDGREHLLDLRSPTPGRFAWGYTWIDGTEVVSAEVEGDGPKLQVALRGQVLPVEVADLAATAAAAVVARVQAKPAGPTTIRAPIPGRVAKILVRVGDEVKAGGALAVIEAMKMENELRAPRDGRVKELRVAEGNAVDAGQDLVILD